MGKKGKGNKLAKMSEEERARYLQARADIEEETRRRKMQLISLYMKNKLKREDAFCRLNMAKINLEWRSVLRQVKVQELHNEIVELEKLCEEAVKRKDGVIQRLLNDLEIAEDMYANMLQSHMENIENFIELHKKRIDFFRQCYEDNKNAILEKWQEDFTDFKSARDHSQVQLECVSYQLDKQTDQSIKDNYERHLERVDDLKSGMQVDLEEITRKGEEKLEKLWQNYQDVLAGYVSHTESFFAEYVDLKERDQESAAVIRDQKFEMQQLSDQLAQLKLFAADLQEKQEVKVKSLQTIRDELKQNLGEMRKQSESELTSDAEKIKLLSVRSYNVSEYIKKIMEKGEAIIQLGKVCQKYTTERERMQPLGLPPMPGEMFKDSIETIELSEEVTAMQKETGIDYFSEMDKFWRRVNNVAVDVACLKQTKKEFEKENASLKVALQEHLITLNINNGSNSHINDYLAKRPSSMHVDRVTQMQLLEPKKVKSAGNNGAASRLRPLRTAPACIEANLSNAVRSRELAKTKQKLPKIDIHINW